MEATMVHLIIVLAVIGFALFILLQYIPMPAPIKQVIIGIVALCMVVLVLNFIGVDTGVNARLN